MTKLAQKFFICNTAERMTYNYEKASAGFFMPLKELWEAYRNRTVSPSLFVSGAYLLPVYSFRKESQIWCVDVSWDGGVSHTILTRGDRYIQIL